MDIHFLARVATVHGAVLHRVVGEILQHESLRTRHAALCHRLQTGHHRRGPLAPPFHLLLTRAGYLVNPATPAQWDTSYRTFGRTPERYRFIRHRVFSVAPTGIEYPHRQPSFVDRWPVWQRQGRGRPSRSAGATAV